MNKKECSNCNMFFTERGWCRRYPPTVVSYSESCKYSEAIEGKVNTYWPHVDKDDWCAEYIEKVKEEE